MAVKYPAFRKRFPLLVTGGLLAMQPLAASLSSAAEQFACQPGASGGWNCAPQSPASDLPPRPSASAANASVAAKPDKPAESRPGKAEQRAEQPLLVTESKGRALASRSSDYSHLDWVPRENLTAAQLAEAGPYCHGAYIEPPRPGQRDDTPMSESPTYVSAKATRYEQEQEIATLAGDVVLRQGSMQAEANEASLYQLENRGELSGNVRIRDNGALLVGDRAEIHLDSGEAKVENAEYVMHQSRTRGSAQYAKREETSIIRLKDGTYTRCEPADNAWHLKGNNVTLDPTTGFGSATNVTLRVKDIPVFYTPYIHFPIDDRRQSGFLMPSIGSASDTGLSLVTPYYFNLAPNFDATLYPHLMTKRGLLMEGEFRYLTRGSEGQIGAAYLDDQEDERKLQSEYEDQRWMYSVQHTTGLDSRWLAELDYTDISDPYYFQDLDTQLGIDKPDFLNQRGSLSYRGDSFTARLNLHAYERATVTDITPYERLPQVTLNGALPFQPGGLRFAYDTEFVSFQRSLKNGNYINQYGLPEQWYDARLRGLNRAEGDRVHLEPSVSLPLNWSWGFLTPKVKYAYTQYDLSLDGTGKASLATGTTFDSNQDRSVPIFSVDSGLYFDRDSNWFGKDYRQSLEPRLFYLYVPEKDQDDIPVFDTGETSFSYSSLWRDNRFSGRDRIGDANQLSLGLTNRWVEPNGFERQRLSIGQTFYFQDRKVQLPGIDYRTRAAAQSSVSPYALEYEYRYDRDWRFASTFNWDPDSHSTRSGSAMLHYQPADNPNKIVNIGYRYRNDTLRFDRETGQWTYDSNYGSPTSGTYIKNYYKISQHDFSTVWPIVPQWSVIARWQHDYGRNRTLEAFGGFEYDSCCWKLRLINRYWIDYDEVGLNPRQNDEPDRGIFLQIVLKGLGGVFGNSAETFLDQGIQGYRQREDQAF
ncbi:LPS-assembly protein LptD [Stutzerimonas kirkiae]|uniref:LPS-assembly protein LptD n=1 Tax=Stutzerimonas kirkiae TaxID=2211392 RepID=A0A4Q9R339_9GAMM|nr:LPS-assembly protein LptD [Stutzerimonas kirkiae]TBU92198.1 LPS biosynthesis protein [Stutzerimonas kirkiae]TBV01178.1 LPS biosynthesis protein [Stutzerimonas kirkiae]TBV10481.1 LPS biosynthesis protein [Stutzerimonas kirkiae]TBV13963.1 LPS biosynthesis protein [Stutzerimonas kirkiae]